jgi:phospholipid transport system substrate-binding protein
MGKYLLSATLFLFLFSVLPAHAAAPLATVQADVTQVLDVVRDKNFSPEAQKEKIRALYGKMFDEEELSRRSLGANWKKLNPDQQQEFMHLYGRLLERAYLDKILSYNNQKILYTRQIIFSPTLAEVQTKIVTPSREIPINYRVIQRANTWKIYDVVIENVSLILNYRSQFRSILARNTPEEMLAILKKKVGEK